VNALLDVIRKSLASRNLFDNWLSLLLKYVLVKIGFNVRLKARANDCILEITPEVYALLVIRCYQGVIKKLKCTDNRVFLNDVEVADLSEVIYNLEEWAKIFGWKYDPSCSCWTKNGVRFKYLRGSILAIFDYGGYYEQLNVRGRVVVDVGAYIGDSAIYFALKGAKKVIAIEPHPGAFNEMLENIRLNSLEDVISPINAGLASRPGKILLEEVDIETTNKTYHRVNDQKGTIPVVTLKDLAERFDLNGAILKMNCEGCEYDIILNDYEHVKMFEELILQYHAHVTKIPAKLLLRKLSKD